MNTRNIILRRYRAVRSHEIAAHAPIQCKAYAILVEARFCSKDKNAAKFFTMQECSPSSTPTSVVRGKGYLCSPSNPVISLLFRDDLPKALKDISDTNRLSSKLTKDTNSTRSARSSQQRPHWQAEIRYDGGRNYNNRQ